MQHHHRQHRRVAREAVRGELLKVAEATFAEKGYEGTRMSDVAVAGQMATGTLYNYFHDKHEMFAAVVHNRAQGLRAALAHRCGGRGCPVSGIVETVTDYVAQYPFAAFLFRLSPVPSSNQDVRMTIQRFNNELESAFAEALQAGQQAGYLRKDVTSRELSIVLAAVVRRAVAEIAHSGGTALSVSGTAVTRLFLEGARDASVSA